jgi:putative membrane protein
MKHFTMLAASLMLLCGCQSNDRTAMRSDSRAPTNADQRFVAAALASGDHEVEMGRVASTRAQSENVRDYGRMMMLDHQRAGDELRRLAERVDYTPEPQGTKNRYPDDSSIYQRGADYDREYIQWMVQDHRKTISLFEAQARNGSDPELVAYANRTLPTLRAHLEAAEQLARQNPPRSGAGGGEATNSAGASGPSSR